MLNVDKWISGFKELTEYNQIKIAEAIKNELDFNEQTFDDDEYDKEKSRIIRSFYDSLIKHANESEQLKSFANVFERYNSLSDKYKSRALNEIYSVVLKYLDCQEQDENKRKCAEEGHIYGKWEERTLIKNEVVWDAGPIGTIEYEHKEWFRTCKRCGSVIKSETEPKEIAAAKKRKEKADEIKKLELRLKKLKGNK